MEEGKYEPNQVVWAKIRGYPWWPSVVKFTQVATIESPLSSNADYRYAVNFIGENTQ